MAFNESYQIINKILQQLNFNHTLFWQWRIKICLAKEVTFERLGEGVKKTKYSRLYILIVSFNWGKISMHLQNFLFEN